MYRKTVTTASSRNMAEAARIEILEGRLFLSASTDTQPPTTAYGSSNVTEDTEGAYSFGVVYADNVAVDPSTLGNTNITVSGPNGFSQTATLLNVNSTQPKPIITGVYQFTPSNNILDTTDNGTYTVSVNANEVKDTSGNAVVAGVVGTFTVNITPSNLVNNTLYINGSDSADSVALNDNGTTVIANVNGVTSTFAQSDVSYVRILGGGGADTINDTSDLRTTVLGGAGGDQIRLGSGDDQALGGRGPDSITGGTGQDTINGNRGHDTIVGGAAPSDLDGGRGADSIMAGASGGDTILTSFGADTVQAHNGHADDIIGGGVNNGSVAHVDQGLDTVTGIGSVLNS